MRTFLALLFFIAAFALPAVAQIAGQCSIDKTVTAGGLTYPQCPFGSTNNFLLQQGFNGARLETDIHLSATPIYAHELCRYTDARSTTAPIFIPFNSASEWQAFVANKPVGVDVAECCVPRAMRRNDVPPPAEACFLEDGGPGAWILEGLVDPNVADLNAAPLIARPASTAPDAPMVLEDGRIENVNYPITSLPIERDDVATVIPKTSPDYVGRFRCGFGRIPVAVDPGGDAGIIKYGSADTITKAATSVKTFVHFSLQCRDADWRAPVCTPGQIGSLITEACPNGQTGSITKRLVLTCPSRDVVEELVSNTCADTCSRTETLPDETEACPAGQTGVIVYGVTKIFFIDPVTQQCISRIEKTVKSNTCTPIDTCTRTEVIRDQTAQCPAGQTGSIIYDIIRRYSPSNGQCVYTDTTTNVRDTCTACARTETRPGPQESCPAGQTGSITSDIVRTYYPSGDQCLYTEAVANRHDSCTPCARTETLADQYEACPAGQEGLIVYDLTRTYYVDAGQCRFNENRTLKSNSCAYVNHGDSGGSEGDGGGGSDGGSDGGGL